MYSWIYIFISYMNSHVGWRLAAALLPQLFGKNSTSHHKGATGRVWTGDQLLPVLCHCQLGQDIPSSTWIHIIISYMNSYNDYNIWIHTNYEFIPFFLYMNSYVHEFVYEFGCTKVPDVYMISYMTSICYDITKLWNHVCWEVQTSKIIWNHSTD